MSSKPRGGSDAPLLVHYGTFGSAGAYIYELLGAFRDAGIPAHAAVSAYYRFPDVDERRRTHRVFFPLTEADENNPHAGGLLWKVRLPIRYLELVVAYLRLLLLVARLNIRTVNVHLIDDFFATWAFVRVLRWMGRRVVVTIHDVERHDDQPDPYRGRVFREGDALIAHNDHSADGVVRIFGADPARIRRLSYPLWDFSPIVDPAVVERVRAEVRARVGERMLFLFFGYMRPAKGFDLLARAWQRGLCDRDDVHLLVAGSPSGQERELEVWGCGNVEWVARRIPDDELMGYLRAADVVVLPYRASYANSAVLQVGTAVAGRLPVVSRIPLFTDLLPEDRAVFFDPEDAAALEQSLVRLAAHPRPDVLDMGRAAQAVLIARARGIEREIAAAYGIAGPDPA